jgi:hypothetical protein
MSSDDCQICVEKFCPCQRYTTPLRKRDFGNCSDFLGDVQDRCSAQLVKADFEFTSPGKSGVQA